MSSVVEPFLTAVANEMDVWQYHEGTWRGADEKALRQAVSLTSWIWQASSIYTAYTRELVAVRQCAGPRHLLTKPISASLDPAIAAASRSSALTKSTAEAETRANIYANLLTNEPQKADNYLSKLLMEKGVGLPDLKKR